MMISTCMSKSLVTTESELQITVGSTGWPCILVDIVELVSGQQIAKMIIKSGNWLQSKDT